LLSVAIQTLGGIYAVVKRDMIRAASYRVALVAVAVSEVFGLLLFYYISRLVAVEPFTSPGDYFEFVVVGLVALQLANAVLYFPITLVQQELVAGTFERLVISPLGSLGGIAGMMVFPVLAALVTNTIALTFAVIVLDLSLEATAPLAIPVSVLVSLAFAPLGLLIVALGLVIKQAGGLIGFVITGLALAAGLYFPVALLPSWIEWISEAQPLTPAVDLMRSVLIGTDTQDAPALIAGKLALFAIVLMPFALWVASRAIDVTRRRGTIVEY